MGLRQTLDLGWAEAVSVGFVLKDVESDVPSSNPNYCMDLIYGTNHYSWDAMQEARTILNY